ncbi:MAG: hypothetical protein KDD04_06625 [Sinomicrobium sp.]|nr:hypothetical protein [Sinomicrobium sp.]
MKLPKFLLGDNTAYPDTVFVIHTDYPRFILDVMTDEVELLEAVDTSDEDELRTEMENLIRNALDFYDSELKKYADE